ncbi:MAG: hypothetical protein MJ093_03230, partial [Saccharofermentans sp.]|nr:hypothetical protein [Saccharofermentans sp.]
MEIDSLRFFNKKEIRNILGLNISRNTFGTSYSKNCLILYRMLPFKKKLGDSHQNEVQVIEIAKIISEQGYNVDVIDYDNYTIKLRNTYDLIFDICPAERPVYQHCLSPNARKILYLTGSNASFANNAELERIESVFNRKGVRLLPRRQSPCLGREIESFDGTIIIGNEYNLSTYDNYDLKNKYMVPNTGYDFAFSRNTSHKDPKKFLYFGSAGSVHKGLDLLLDVFAQNDFPCELYVCGGYGNEADFVE